MWTGIVLQISKALADYINKIKGQLRVHFHDYSLDLSLVPD